MLFCNYLKVALRNLLRKKGFSLINIAGLTVGIAVCFLIFLWVKDELSYDLFHQKSDRTYRLLWDARYGDNEWTIPLGPVPAAEVMRSNFPQVENVVRMVPTSQTLRQGEGYVIEPRFFYTENSFFDVFTVSLISGNAETALNDPSSVVLTEESAARFFPQEPAVGQTLELNDGRQLKVTAVVAGFPSQSHFHFDFLTPLKDLPIIEQRANHWGSATVYTYFTLKEEADASDFSASLDTYVQTTVMADVEPGSGNYSRFLLQPLSDIYLKSHLQYEIGATGNIVYVYLFTGIALFILILACINFVNLSTARSVNRAREVGLRKVFGSYRTQLIRQFFTESVLYVLAAVLLAVGLVEILLPQFNVFVNKNLATDYLGSESTLVLLLSITGVVAFLAGLYPALVLSTFRPVRALRGRNISVSKRNWLRNGLVILQFCISISLIIGTFTVRNQIQYMQSKRLGFDKEHVLVVQNARTLGNRYTAFRERLRSLPDVASASATQSLPGSSFDSMIFVPEQPANYDHSSLTYAMIDEHYVDVLDLQIVDGRNFSAKFSTDSTAFLINETAAERLGWAEPVGRQITMANITGSVVGVIEDFHFQSLHHEVKPAIFPFIRWGPFFIAVRMRSGNISQSIETVRNLWQEFAPQQPFRYSFLEADYGQLYASEKDIAKIFGVFSTVAIFIACLGLFGLAAFTASQRTKEVGIRKVLGASVAGIALLHSRDFLKLVVLANIAAWPIAWVAMNGWLENFAYRTTISWWTFLAAAGAALLIALLTVSSHAIKAAMANPARSLRYE